MARYEAICGCGAVLKVGSVNGAVWWDCRECHAEYHEAVDKPPRPIQCTEPGALFAPDAPGAGDAGQWREVKPKPKSKAEQIIDAICKIPRRDRTKLIFLMSKADVSAMRDASFYILRPPGLRRFENAEICGVPVVVYDAEGE